MSLDTRSEYRRQDHEALLGGQPFDENDRVVFPQTGDRGSVIGVEHHAGYADRADEPGESPWWEITVRWDNGVCDEYDADELEAHEDDEDKA